MGGGNSKEEWRQEPPSPSSSSWASHQSYPQYGPDSYNYPPPPTYTPTPAPVPAPVPASAPSFGHQSQLPYIQEGYASASQPYHPPPPSQNYGNDRKKFDRRYSKISDNYSSLDQVSSRQGII